MNDISPLLFFTYVVSNTLALYISQTTLIFSSTITKKKRVVYICVILLFSILNLRFNVPHYIFIFASIFLIGIFTKPHLLNMILALIGYITSVCYNYVFLNVFCSISNINQATLTSSLLYQWLFYLIFYPTLYLLLKGLKFFINYLPNIDKTIQKSLLTSLFLFLFVCAFILIFNFSYEQSQGYTQEIMAANTRLFLLFFLMVAILLAVIIAIIYKDAKTKQALKEMEHLKKYTQEIEDLYTSLRSFKHDYTNVLCSMKHYIDNKQYQELNAYYENDVLPLLTSLDASTPAVEKLSNMKVPELKSIIYLKILEAAKKEVQANLEIKWPIEHINMKAIDLTRVIGILLDNAIEATMEVENPTERIINISCIKANTNVVIIISNPSVSDSINLQNIQEAGITTKGKDHGIGLTNVKSILNKYNNILLSTSYKNNIFTQTMEISNM